MKTFTIRLFPGQDLKKELDSLTKRRGIKAGAILTCVGSLAQATLRLADENVVKNFNQKFEIVSLVGTLSQDGMHTHIGLADDRGSTIGGHLKEGCIIHTTAEIVIADLDPVIFKREPDEKTGFDELKIL